MKTFLILLTLVCSTTSHLFSQVDRYTTSGGELIFSNSDYSGGKAIRFSPVVNIQNHAHFDFSESLGVFTGLSVRNVGLIYDESESIRKKARTYNLGIPVAIKFGQMNAVFFYAGYEIEFPLSYKEKTFVNEAKEDKFNTWFSGRTPGAYHTVMAGIQFPYGANLKFKYYLTPFYDKDYDASDPNGNPIVYPEVNVYYLSLSFMLFRNTTVYYLEE